MKLFVDDIRKCPKGWHLARTVTQAISVLSRGVVEEVSLDHDIAYQHCPGNIDFETFMPVAQYIALMSKKPVVRIHTGNISAGQRMAEVIGIQYMPYIYDEKDYTF